jgi:hypothetical protein
MANPARFALAQLVQRHLQTGLSSFGVGQLVR